MTKLLRYIGRFKRSIVVVIFFAVLSTSFSIVSPKILGNVTNQIVDDFIKIVVYDKVTSGLPSGTTLPEGTKGSDILANTDSAIVDKIPADQLETIKSMDFSTRPTIDFDKIGQILLFLVGLYLLSVAFNYTQSWIMTKIAQEVSYKLREEVLQKINKLPLKYFDSHAIGDVLSRITNDIDTIGQTLNQSLTQVVTSIITIIGILIMMLTISWQLTIIAVLVLPVSFGIIGFIVKSSQRLFKQQADDLGEINGHIEEIYGAHNIVSAYNGEAAAINEFNRINANLYDSGWRSQFFSGLMMPIMNIINNIGYVLVATVGGWLAFQGRIGIGDIQAFIQYLQQFSQPVMQAANTTNVLQSTAAAAERVFEFLEEPDEVAEATAPKVIEAAKGHVELDHVVFGYDEDKVVIKDVSVEVQPGQKVAIVGPTGSGKTTIVNLLMRFYDVDSGTIRIDGVDVREMTRANLRSQFGMVLQDTWLFNGTIRDNVAYSKEGATEDEIVNASRLAQVDHFVHSLPNGYDMELNESSDNVSQGEKQLLTIARAMLADAPILILDEATSSVDTRTEVLIQAAMNKLMEGRTSFIIAHRLSTIKNADLILVIRDGNIIEQGTHEELLSQNGFYAELYNSQFAE
ncbi:ABC transporter ATP-binding protein [candidate division WWE3 bacterium]|uniref:ABC transporter ATP-binding protein n=1 Tax=candidate division WWE3 bacterium TaxID=2053526 RepID=A0A955LKX3_UNCKA|nr:ABC transporter ATP-binding protein [candidate division WWE3 bacterium]